MMIRQMIRGIGEAIRGLRRNALVGFVCVTTVALSLLIVGVFVLVGINLEHIAHEIESQVEIKVYLVDELPADYISDLERAVLSVSGVTQVKFISKDQALEILREQFGHEAGVLDAVEEMNPLPDSFDVTVDPEYLVSAATRIGDMPGVDKVRDQRDLVARLLALTRAVRTAGFFLAVALAVAAMFIIANTIRIAVFTRRAEIGIMKLVGATDGYIRGPFMVEGMILGGIGAALAGTALWYGYEWLLMQIGQALPFLPIVPLEPVALDIVRGLVIAGVLLGVLGSAISVRRYLRA